jgi:hypothetical protein
MDLTTLSTALTEIQTNDSTVDQIETNDSTVDQIETNDSTVDQIETNDPIADELSNILTASTVDHKMEIMNMATLKDAHCYCFRKQLIAQQFGPGIERYLINKFRYNRNYRNETNGDCSKDGNNYEVKVSLGGINRNQYNYVQIRPFHNIQYYLLTAYHVDQASVKSHGSLFIFKVSKEDMIILLVNHGSYAHGTFEQNGAITLDTLYDIDNKKEYVLRPKLGDTCWQDLLAFQITESQL